MVVRKGGKNRRREIYDEKTYARREEWCWRDAQIRTYTYKSEGMRYKLP